MEGIAPSMFRSRFDRRQKNNDTDDGIEVKEFGYLDLGWGLLDKMMGTRIVGRNSARDGTVLIFISKVLMLVARITKLR